MKQIADGIFYCGLHDRQRKIFDQLVPLPQGTTYNAFVVKGSQKCALIDTMYEKLSGTFCDAIAAAGLEIDYIVSNHAEPDHSAAIPALLEMFPQARVLCSPKCAENLQNMLGVDAARIDKVSDGEERDLGGKTLRFISAPWVHWPDTMFTHLVEDNFLFTCDFFGAHYTDNELFADYSENLAAAAKRYYAEIMMPFANFCAKYLEKVAQINPKMILPSHGPIYDKPEFIMNLYRHWVLGKPAKKVLIAYVSMYDNTRIMADYLENALKSRGIGVVKADLIEADEGELAMELIDSPCAVFGTSMVLTGPHPKTIYAAYLMNILRPKLKYFAVIGSFGWAGNLEAPIEGMFKLTKPEKLPAVIVKGRPTSETFHQLEQLSEEIVSKIA